MLVVRAGQVFRHNFPQTCERFKYFKKQLLCILKERVDDLMF